MSITNHIGVILSQSHNYLHLCKLVASVKNNKNNNAIVVDTWNKSCLL